MNNSKRPKRKGSYRKSGSSDSRGNDREERFGSSQNGRSRSSDNDPSWYTANGQLLKDTSSFNFNRPAGMKVQLNNPYTASDPITVEVPGIMSIYTMPTVGCSHGPASPVNKAAQKVYSFVRHANSGHSNYDPVDLMMYLLAMDSLYTFWAYMTRVYGALQIFSKDNYFIGDALVRAMGVDDEDLRANIAQFRAYINMFAVKASTFAVPNTMTYFIRHSWMYTNVYKDEDTARAQMYLYVPAGLYQYSVDPETGAGMLKFKFLTCDAGASHLGRHTPLRLADLMEFGNDLLSAMLSVEDVGIMSGDILKAYGAEGLWKLVQIPENYGLQPVFSEEVLAQIHNTDFVGWMPCNAAGVYGVTELDVRQNPNVGHGEIIFHPYFKGSSRLVYDKLLDFWKQDVTPELSMVASRNMVLAMHNPQGSIAIEECGSEITLFASIWWYRSTSTEAGVYTELFQSECYTSDLDFAQYKLLMLSKFNEVPHALVLSNLGDSVGYWGELNNFALIGHDDLMRMHECAMLSMFNVANIT